MSCQPLSFDNAQDLAPLHIKKVPRFRRTLILSFSYCLFFFIEAHCFFGCKEQFIFFFAAYDHVFEFT